MTGGETLASRRPVRAATTTAAFTVQHCKKPVQNGGSELDSLSQKFPMLYQLGEEHEQ